MASGCSKHEEVEKGTNQDHTSNHEEERELLLRGATARAGAGATARPRAGAGATARTRAGATARSFGVRGCGDGEGGAEVGVVGRHGTDQELDLVGINLRAVLDEREVDDGLSVFRSFISDNPRVHEQVITIFIFDAVGRVGLEQKLVVVFSGELERNVGNRASVENDGELVACLGVDSLIRCADSLRLRFRRRL